VTGVREITLASVSPDRMRAMVTATGWAKLDAGLQGGHAGLRDRTVWMVNSTAVGGGVAELLRASLPYFLGAGLDLRWG
jgi:hypothetical protein